MMKTKRPQKSTILIKREFVLRERSLIAFTRSKRRGKKTQGQTTEISVNGLVECTRDHQSIIIVLQKNNLNQEERTTNDRISRKNTSTGGEANNGTWVNGDKTLSAAETMGNKIKVCSMLDTDQ